MGNYLGRFKPLMDRGEYQKAFLFLSQHPRMEYFLSPKECRAVIDGAKSLYHGLLDAISGEIHGRRSKESVFLRDLEKKAAAPLDSAGAEEYALAIGIDTSVEEYLSGIKSRLDRFRGNK